LPGSRRPAQEKNPRATSPGAWIAEPVAPQPAKPMGWEYDDPNPSP
jgi:hypothetical protein